MGMGNEKKNKKHEDKTKTDKFLRYQNSLTAPNTYPLQPAPAPSNAEVLASINAQLVGFTLADILASATKISNLYTLLVQQGFLVWNDLYLAGITPSLNSSCKFIPFTETLYKAIIGTTTGIPVLVGTLGITPQSQQQQDQNLLAIVATDLIELNTIQSIVPAVVTPGTFATQNTLQQYQRYIQILGQISSDLLALNNPTGHLAWLSTGATTPNAQYPKGYYSTVIGISPYPVLSLATLQQYVEKYYNLMSISLEAAENILAIQPQQSAAVQADIFSKNIAIILNSTSTASPNGSYTAFTEMGLILGELIINWFLQLQFNSPMGQGANGQRNKCKTIVTNTATLLIQGVNATTFPNVVAAANAAIALSTQYGT